MPTVSEHLRTKGVAFDVISHTQTLADRTCSAATRPRWCHSPGTRRRKSGAL